MAKIQTVIDNAVLGVSIVGGIALASGVLILIGAVAMTKYSVSTKRRSCGRSAPARGALDDAGARVLRAGLLAGIIGAAGALRISWGVTRHVLDIPWRPAPGLLALARC